MSTHAELELRYDGPIPAGELAQARLEYSQRPRPAAYIGKVTPKPAAIIENMARSMRVVAALNGTVMAPDLLALGFTPTEIALYAESASRRAAQLSDGCQRCEPIELMAEELLEVAGRQESCSDRDLIARGFTMQDIEKYGEAAILLAAQLSCTRGEA